MVFGGAKRDIAISEDVLKEPPEKAAWQRVAAPA
jgi:hypothetical protein